MPRGTRHRASDATDNRLICAVDAVAVAARAALAVCTATPAMARRALLVAVAPPPRRRQHRAALTADTYPALRRDERFGRLTPQHAAAFRDMLGAGGVLEAAGDVDAYNEDWMGKYRGQGRLVLRPRDTAEASRLLAYCNRHRLAVVPQGGTTGLVGGSVPVFDEVVVSTARMDRIHAFDATSGCLTLDAGVVLEAADAYLAERGHVFPLDLGAKGSCHVGGNVATNAGGLRFLRYGSLHGSVVGLEAVLPDGTVLDDLSTLRKNNTGYDLKQLFIGAEGSLGLVTRLAVHCPPRPAAVHVALLGLASYADARRAFALARAHLGEVLSAFELMDARSQDLVHAARPDRRRPLDARHPFYCLVETSGSVAEHDYAKLDAFLERAMADAVVADGVVAQDASQAKALWAWREAVPECVGHWGGVYKYDVSISLPDMYALVGAVEARLADASLLGDDHDRHPALAVVGYGHMGDCNLHLNVAVRRYDKRVEQALEPFVFEWIQQKRGSISAEHGLGLAKKSFIKYSRSDTTVALMKQIKHLFDPVSLPPACPCSPLLAPSCMRGRADPAQNAIMNPYKYI